MSERARPGEPPTGGRLTPVARGSLTDRVIEQLRTRIADTTWPLHHRLPVEAALAAELGVGRSTIREAVRVLVHLGLLEVRQGDGTYVRSHREIDTALERQVAGARILEAYEMRRGLEVECARQAAGRRSAADVHRLRELVGARRSSHSSSALEFRAADSRLSEQLARAAGSPLLLELHHAVSTPLRQRLARALGDSELALYDPDAPELDQLVEALDRRDERAAVDAVTAHFAGALRVLRLLVQEVTPGR